MSRKATRRRIDAQRILKDEIRQLQELSEHAERILMRLQNTMDRFRRIHQSLQQRRGIAHIPLDRWEDALISAPRYPADQLRRAFEDRGASQRENSPAPQNRT